MRWGIFGTEAAGMGPSSWWLRVSTYKTLARGFVSTGRGFLMFDELKMVKRGKNRDDMYATFSELLYKPRETIDTFSHQKRQWVSAVRSLKK